MLLGETNWVSNGIAGLALTVSGVALYLQRRDSHPRISVSASDKMVGPQIRDKAGGRMASETKEPAQVFEIRNIGMRQVRIHSVRARWLWGRPAAVSGDWNRTPLLEPDTVCECTLFMSKVPQRPLTRFRRTVPFYRVEFLDQVGRAWSAGYRRIPL